jgi:hypothetical protein
MFRRNTAHGLPFKVTAHRRILHCAGDQQLAEGDMKKAPGLRRVEELMRVIASANDMSGAVKHVLLPFLFSVQGSSINMFAYDRALHAILSEVSPE